MKIRVLKGTDEIGGSCIEISTTNTTILLDYGTPLTHISLLMEELHSIIDENADVIFGVTSNNELETDIVEYKIIVSGVLL